MRRVLLGWPATGLENQGTRERRGSTPQPSVGRVPRMVRGPVANRVAGELCGFDSRSVRGGVGCAMAFFEDATILKEGLK